MTTPHPDYRRSGGHWADEHDGMETCTLRPSQWRFARLFGGNPLVRASDRIEAVVLVLAIVLAVLAVPAAAAVGTAVYDSRRPLYAEQVQTQRLVTATVIDNRATQQSSSKTASKTVTVRVRWFVDGIERTGVVKARQPVNHGDAIDIWVDNDGSQTDPPLGSAGDKAVVAAIAIWLGVALAATALFLGTRAVLNRSRYARWQHDFDNLTWGSDGHPSR